MGYTEQGIAIRFTDAKEIDTSDESPDHLITKEVFQKILQGRIGFACQHLLGAVSDRMREIAETYPDPTRREALTQAAEQIAKEFTDGG